MTTGHVVATHHPAAVPLWLGLAILPGGAVVRPGAGDYSTSSCPALHQASAATTQKEQPHLFGYRLLQAGRVDDAVAFFQLHVAHTRVHPARTDRGSM